MTFFRRRGKDRLRRFAIYRYPRKLAVWIIAFTPGNRARVTLYKLICGYRISTQARIGFGTVIALNDADISAASIGRFNRFQGPFALRIRDGSRIGDRNAFECGEWILSEKSGAPGSCDLGADTLITGNHYVDVTKGFTLGARSWIAGRDTQVWTHGAGDRGGGVRVGSDCYVGSAARFAPGSGVGDRCVIAMGSVVTRFFESPGMLVGGVPARVIREEKDWTRDQMEEAEKDGTNSGVPLSGAAPDLP